MDRRLVVGQVLSSKSGDELRPACGKVRTGRETTDAHVAQLVEHVLGKDEVTGSIPVMGSMSRPIPSTYHLDNLKKVAAREGDLKWQGKIRKNQTARERRHHRPR